MASLDLTLLRALKHRENYDKFAKHVPEGAVNEYTRIVLDDFGKYFRAHPDVTVIQHVPFFTYFKAFLHRTLTEERTQLFDTLIRDIDKDVDAPIIQGLMLKLAETRTVDDTLTIAERWREGDEISIGTELRALLDRHEQDVNKNVKVPWVTDDVAGMLDEEKNDHGFKWRLAALNDSIRPLRGGDNIIIAARPDVGKTTFNTDELTFMAPQVDEVYPGEGREILWFNNEGPGRRIKLRLYQSALNATMSDLVNYRDDGSLHKRYLDATGGRENIIRVFDIHDFWNHEVEDIIKRFPPAMILFDMVDNIKFAGSVNNNGQRTDQLLEAMYQWARVLGVKYDCPVISNSQISADGEGMQYPTLSMLKDSKTGKQGAADAIITIGTNPEYPNARFLNTTKNKLARESGPKQPKLETYFDGLRGRYNMPKVA